MNARDVVRRLEAFRVGAPLPRGDTLHVPIAAAEDLLLVAFVRMGGESAPWGIGWRHPGRRTTVAIAAEPRNRDLAAAAAMEFARVLLPHVGHPSTARAGVPAQRQIWLPNPTHVDMLHFLAFRYRFVQDADGSQLERALLLNALGRACGYLFREAQRPGQVTVIDATWALREAWTFPADDVRQAHLRYLLAWLETAGERAARMAAAEAAEQIAVATSLDPDVENTLFDRVEAFNAARRGGGATEALAAPIRTTIERELCSRLDATEAAIAALCADVRPVNRGVARLVAHAHDEWLWGYRNAEDLLTAGEKAFIPSPETDHSPVAAALGYVAQEIGAQLVFSALVHHDADLLADAVAAGNAITGEIAEVRDEGKGRAVLPVWRVRGAASPLRLRVGDVVAVVGAPGRKGKLRRIDECDDQREVEVEITGWKRARPADGICAADDARLQGTRVAFVEPDTSDFLKMRRKFMNREGPGAWLTRRRAPAKRVDAVEEEDD